MSILWFLVPVFMGLCQPILWQMTLRLASVAGNMPAAVILHAVGTVAGGLFMAAGLRGGNNQWNTLPWWAWLGGAVGVICLYLLNLTLPRIGVAPLMGILVASQLISGLLFEKYGLMGAALREPTPSHWLGVVLLSAGAYLITRV